MLVRLKTLPYKKIASWFLFIILLLWCSMEFSNGYTVLNSATISASDLKAAELGTFSVVTYNIAGLPAIISSAKTRRDSSIAEIGKRLNKFDIAHVQEDFNYNPDLYLNGNAHRYRTKSMGGVPFGDGLNTLSNYPVHGIQRIAWDDCTGADCLTPKGFTFSRIEVAKNILIDFYNIHANAFNDPSAAAARRQNIVQLSAFIKDHSAGNAVIVMGDLNGHYSFERDNIKLLHTGNGMTDAWIQHHRGMQFPLASSRLPDRDILSLAPQAETIDKVLFRSSGSLQLKATDYQLESLDFRNRNGLPLSDHHPVSARFEWRLRATQSHNQ